MTYIRVMRTLAVAVMLLTAAVAEASDWLFRSGRSSYQIVVAANASASERTAARELQDYLCQMSGARLPITSEADARGRHIFLGFSPRVAALTGRSKPAADDEGFTYRTVGRDLLIWGGSDRGTMYGVFTFLEKELGIHWLTPDCTVVPRLRRWRLPRLDHSERPAVGYRYTNYRVSHNQPIWSAHVKENMRWTPVANDYGNLQAYWSCHTMGVLVPTSEFYERHPEYFCLRDGKRMSKYEQLCLSNPDVLLLCKERLAKVMREQPAYRIYSLSQNDNNNFCQCPRCVAIEEQYGGHSGLIIWFVNQVADAVRDEFPDKLVGTFAYHYSRKPPVGIVPRANVVVRLCSIECCFAHPLTAGCPQNASFMDDLRGWAAIAPHLFIWDYIVDYAQYMAPWPNFQVLAPNIRTFREHKAIGIFEEAAYQSLGAEFEELKSWTVAQLLWNPWQNTDSLVTVFINGYYGQAAPRVMDYYRLCQSMVKPDVHFGIYIRENHALYTDEFLSQALHLLGQAARLADSEEMAARVERVRMQPLFLHCMRHPDVSRQDGTWDELMRLMKKYKVRPREGQTLDDFLSNGR